MSLSGQKMQLSPENSEGYLHNGLQKRNLLKNTNKLRHLVIIYGFFSPPNTTILFINIFLCFIRKKFLTEGLFHKIFQPFEYILFCTTPFLYLKRHKCHLSKVTTLASLQRHLCLILDSKSEQFEGRLIFKY